MTGKIFDRIELMRGTATKTEQVLIAKLKEIPKEELIYMSITEVAEQTGVAEATILRFCRKLGLKGYQDFKLMLSQDISFQPTGESYAKQIADEMVDAIMQTLSVVQPQVFSEAAAKIIDARKTSLFAVGNSGLAAMEMQYRLIKAGLVVENLLDSHMQAIATANLQMRDVLVLISMSGSTKDILNLASAAKASGVFLIVITNFIKSPLAKLADLNLYSAWKEAPFEGGSFVTKVAQLYTIDVLCTEIYRQLGENASRKAQKASAAVSDKLM